jgi:branched-chain amino acid transport system ATP-binding protein
MALLQAIDISMHFGGVKAVNELNLTVEKGQIFGIIGPNGSGKTTFFNVLTGQYRPTGGNFIFVDRDITARPPHAIAKLGIARTFQNIRLFQNMTVMENVLVGQHVRLGETFIDSILYSKRKLRLEAGARARAHELLQFVGLDDKADELAANLAYGEQRRVELARALAITPSLLLLDELTAGMNPSEANTVVELIRSVRRRDVTIVIIEHNMKVMMNLAEWIVVMDAGRKIAEGIPSEVQKNELVIRAYLGEDEDTHAVH